MTVLALLSAGYATAAAALWPILRPVRHRRRLRLYEPAVRRAATSGRLPYTLAA